MLVDTEQLEYLKSRFTELGATVQKLSEENEYYFDGILDDFDEFKSALDDIVGSDYLSKIKKGVQEIHDSKSEIMEMLSKSTKNVELSFNALGGIPEAMKEEFERFSDKLKDSSRERKDFSRTYKEGGTPLDRLQDDSRGKPTSIPGASLVKKEFGTLKSKVKGFLGMLKAPSPGTVLATGAIWMAFGFKDRDRVAKEAGEIRDVLVYAADSGIKGAVSKATSHLSAMQETLQKFYGIPRQAVQQTADAFSRAGVSTDEFLGKIETPIKGVKDTTHSYAMAVDLFLNQASGTAAKKMTEYMGDYGKTLSQSRESLEKMLDYAADSGIGVQQFMSNIEMQEMK